MLLCVPVVCAFKLLGSKECIRFPVNGHLDYFQGLAITNESAMNILAHVFLWTSLG